MRRRVPESAYRGAGSEGTRSKDAGVRAGFKDVGSGCVGCAGSASGDNGSKGSGSRGGGCAKMKAAGP
eukprot:CAMPEP_0194308764 /NCGR_PEP_ID=MMETSP0171-20130528/5732_1 /TAXON_ID=218684 /ORGANISM="Corethron pennatum, Strain L29A3" /LENGTH=67 /DNA_ID=CAMNT_0039061563 /DNA_START=38 /DNA_END=238 /DNA_ORIENTATION=+